MFNKIRWRLLLAALLVVAVTLVACQPAAPAVDEEAQARIAELEAQLAAAQESGGASEEEIAALQAQLEAAQAAVAEAQAAAEATTAAAAGEEAAQTEFLSMGDMDRQLAQMEMEPLNPDAPLWEQMLEPADMVDTSMYAKDPPWHVCFSNASVANSWRVVGYAVMEYEVSQHPEIGKWTVTDAQENSEKQISDIEDLLTKDCDILIVSPATTEALTPAVERAADTGIPVVVFDRGVNTDKYTSFIHPIGGFAFGYVGAKWLAEEMGGQGKVLMLRVLPGVDVLETRYQAALEVFVDYPNIQVVGVEFNQADQAQAKQITLDYLERYGGLDGVWTDYGGVSAAVYEAFVDYGADVPPITGEDFNGWLKVWKANNLRSIAPTYPTYQWRTAVIAAVRILSGEPVPKEWVLPQPPITEENLDEFVRPDLPDGHFAMCGCSDIPGFLEELWGSQ